MIERLVTRQDYLRASGAMAASALALVTLSGCGNDEQQTINATWHKTVERARAEVDPLIDKYCGMLASDRVFHSEDVETSISRHGGNIIETFNDGTQAVSCEYDSPSGFAPYNRPIRLRLIKSRDGQPISGTWLKRLNGERGFSAKTKSAAATDPQSPGYMEIKRDKVNYGVRPPVVQVQTESGRVFDLAKDTNKMAIGGYWSDPHWHDGNNSSPDSWIYTPRLLNNAYTRQKNQDFINQLPAIFDHIAPNQE